MYEISEAAINEREEELQNTAARFATQMEAQFDVDLDFTVESLARLDGMLDQMIDLSEAYWSDRPDDLLPVALAITAYVGEVFRRSFEGTVWVTEVEEGQIPPPHVRLAGGVRLNLMKKSLQVLTRSDTPSFAGYYTTVLDLVRGRESDPGDDV
jgi:hypothetical protein